MDDFRVDTTIDAGLEAVTRFQSIKRWHMIDTTRTQSIAEHSANVALLAYHIAITSPEVYFGSGETVLAPALFHDLPEVFVGDIPTHTKKHLTGLIQLEDLLTPPEFKCDASDQVHALVKLCDLADGIRFIERYGVDRVAIFATEGLRVQLKARLVSARANWPEHVFNHVDDKISTYVHQ